jgi:hypothetical protein
MTFKLAKVFHCNQDALNQILGRIIFLLKSLK